MNTTTYDLSAQTPKAARVIFWGGLIAGILDITGACVVSWFRSRVPPVRIFQSVAAGIYGSASSSMGAKTAVLGLALHFLIATTWTAIYYATSRKIRFLVNQPIIAGVLYGVVVHLFMNFVVIPLSAIGRRPVTLKGQMIGMTIIILCVGLPIAFIVRKFSK
jgi:hypothetical protein